MGPDRALDRDLFLEIRLRAWIRAVAANNTGRLCVAGSLDCQGSLYLGSNYNGQHFDFAMIKTASASQALRVIPDLAKAKAVRREGSRRVQWVPRPPSSSPPSERPAGFHSPQPIICTKRVVCACASPHVLRGLVPPPPPRPYAARAPGPYVGRQNPLGTRHLHLHRRRMQRRLQVGGLPHGKHTCGVHQCVSRWRPCNTRAGGGRRCYACSTACSTYRVN